MSTYIFEGIGKPKIIFDNGDFVTLPEPNGSGKDGLRAYDFEETILSTYRSENNIEIEIGKKFRFIAKLSWYNLSKTFLKHLNRACNESSFIFILNEDEGNIQYRVKAKNLKYKFPDGCIDHPAGYTVSLDLKGIEWLQNRGYGVLQTGTGYGTNYGESNQNQSP